MTDAAVKYSPLYGHKEAVTLRGGVLDGTEILVYTNTHTFMSKTRNIYGKHSDYYVRDYDDPKIFNYEEAP